jgi:hypothetical protein
MARTYDLLIRARGDSKDAQRAMGAARKSVVDLQQSVQNFGRGIRNVGAMLTATVTLPLILAARVGIDELNSAQAAAAQTNAVLKSTGGVAGVSAARVSNLATALMKMSGIDDQVIQGGENILLTFTKIGAKDGVFDRATRAALDLSVAFGKDMNSSAILVGKALQDPVKGVAALSRVGVSFTKQQKAVIKKLVETGKSAQAQKLILRELEMQVGGSAKAFGTTAAGAVGRLKEQFAGIAARMVTMLLPAFVKLTGWLERGMNWFEGLSGSTQKWIGVIALVGGVVGPVLIVLGTLVAAIAAIGAIGMLVVTQIGLMAGIFVVAYKRSGIFRSFINKLASALRAYVKILVSAHGAIARLVSRVVTAITSSERFRTIVGGVSTALRAYVKVLVTVYGTIATFVVRVGSAIAHSQTFRAWLELTKGSLKVVGAALGLVIDALIGIARAVGTAAGKLSGVLKPALTWIQQNGGQVFDRMTSAIGRVDSVIAAVIRKVASLIEKVERVISKIKSIPDIPGLGGPGRSTSDTSGRPGSRSRSIGGASRSKSPITAQPASLSMSRGRSGPTVVQHIYPQSQDVESIARRVAFLISSGKVTLKPGIA